MLRYFVLVATLVVVAILFILLAAPVEKSTVIMVCGKMARVARADPKEAEVQVVVFDEVEKRFHRGWWTVSELRVGAELRLRGVCAKEYLLFGWRLSGGQRDLDVPLETMHDAQGKQNGFTYEVRWNPKPANPTSVPTAMAVTAAAGAPAAPATAAAHL